MRMFIGDHVRKIVATLATLVTLVAVGLVAAPALAADTFTVTASGGATGEVGGSFSGVTKTSALAGAGSYTQTIEQTWPSGRAGLGGVGTPENWTIEYKVDGAWVSQKPNDTTTIEGVRTTGISDYNGVSGANQKKIVTSNATFQPGSPASIPSTGRGDGWDVTVTPKYILNVFHHDSSFRLECHIRATFDVCDSNAVYQVQGYYTSNVSGLTYYNGKAYALVVNQSTNSAAMLCTNVSSLPFTNCGVVDLEPGVNDAQSSLSGQQKIGTKVYAADLANNKILCFDLVANSACTEIPVTGLAHSNANSPAFTAVIGGRLYVTANKLYCFDVTTNQLCAGYPVGDFSNGGAVTNAIPMIDTANNNAVSGACTFTVQLACYGLNGASATFPAGLSAMLNTTATSFHAGDGYFETNAFIGSKVYWASNPNGNSWSSGTATCYDWAIDAACAGFDSTVDVGASRYAFRLDPYNSNCVWANGDNGALAAFTASTGVAGCAVDPASSLDFPTSTACSAANSVVGLYQLKVTIPNTVSMSDIRVTVFDSNRTAINNYTSITPNGSGIIDLSALTATQVGDDFTFEIKAAGATEQELTAITGELIYLAKPAELCVTVDSLKSICGDTVTPGVQVAQPGIAFASATSFQRSGSALVSSNLGSRSFNVDSMDPINCSKWSTLTATNETGLHANGGDAGIVDFVWDSNGHPYVGGYFNNAAGVEAADNLAYWNGTAWVAVGATDPQQNPINGRVAALAFHNGKLYVGGDFQDAGGVANADNFAIYDVATQTWSGVGPDANTSAFNNFVRAIAVDATSGKVYVGGNFNDKLKQIAAGETDATVVGVSGDLNRVVHFLSVASNGVLTVGGNFYDVGSSSDDYLVTWNGTTWSPISASQPMYDQVWSVARHGTKTYVTGDFDGVQVYDSSSDTWSFLGSANWDARSIAVSSSGQIYAATGGFNSGYWAHWNGSTWVSLSDGDTSSNAGSTNSCDYDWCGSWKTKFDSAGNIWFGGDITNVGDKAQNDLFVTWGLGATSENNGGGEEEENNGGGDNGGGNNGGGTTTPVEEEPSVSEEVLALLEAPVALPDGALPELKPLDSIVYEDGVAVAVTLTPTVTKDGVILTGPDFSLELKAVAPDGKPLVLDEKGRLVIDLDGKAKFSGSGFMAATPVSLWLFSEPAFLGKTTTNNDGIFNGEVTIPSDVPAGEHTIQLNGVSADGQLRTVAIGIVLGEDVNAEQPTEETPVAAQGSDWSWLFWLFGVLALAAFAWWFIIAKRRNDDEEKQAKK